MTGVRTIPAGEFKARCLALLDEVAETGEHIIVTKRGRPVAEISPPRTPRKADGRYDDGLAGTLIYCGDIISPAVPAEEWEVMR
ncbi:MAG: type II toxin-antitoxin system Phd/YefM family antitoxin [Dehalococcoidia bacterium]|nr:type II toxin-antitoxin system Phd/YefM family antitoxin [Dehalococcoidia bacterium]